MKMNKKKHRLLYVTRVILQSNHYALGESLAKKLWLIRIIKYLKAMMNQCL